METEDTPLGQAGHGAVPLGEGRHDLGMVCDKGRVDAVHLDEIADKLVEQARSCPRRAALDVVLDAQVIEETIGDAMIM